MADTTRKVKQPSNRLLSMKFMQRMIEKEKQKELEEEQKRIRSEAEWEIKYEPITKDPIAKTRVEYEPSYLAFTNTTQVGRQSFRSFNKQVESAGKEAETQQRYAREEEREKDLAVSDDDMMDRMRTIREASQSQKKRKTKPTSSSAKKPKTDSSGFIKPS